MTGSAELERLVRESAREANILPLTSRCDVRCVFCSHKNNPPEVRTISAGVRSMEDVARTLPYLDPGRVITIGESATLIVEGEPLAYPRFKEVISQVRRAFPGTPLEITTNGRRLTDDMVRLLESLGRVSLNVSLNSVSARGRELLMGETRAECGWAVEGVRRLASSSLRFGGSLVAMPHVTGWDDIRDTVAFLATHGAAVVTVVMPAFSSRATSDVLPEADLHGRLREFADSVAAESACPVLIEPSRVMDLTPVVSGVLRHSPAWGAGVRRGDVFALIEGTRPRCRVEAWNLLSAPGGVHAEVLRGGRRERVCWQNAREGDSGITMEYDFDPARVDRLGATIMGCPDRSALLTSALGHAVVQEVLALLGIGPDKAEPVMVENRTFGGTIGAAGLLTVDDYREGYVSWSRAGYPPSQIVVPLEGFDARGVDLKGEHFSKLQESTGVPVVLL